MLNFTNRAVLLHNAFSFGRDKTNIIKEYELHQSNIHHTQLFRHLKNITIISFIGLTFFFVRETRLHIAIFSLAHFFWYSKRRV